jgi:hypothetical protein
MIKLDFPAFGLPTTAKRGNAISSCVGSGFIGNESMHPINLQFHFLKYSQGVIFS